MEDFTVSVIEKREDLSELEQNILSAFIVGKLKGNIQLVQFRKLLAGIPDNVLHGEHQPCPRIGTSCELGAFCPCDAKSVLYCLVCKRLIFH